MDLTVNEYIDGLLGEEARTRPSDSGKVEDLALKMQLPEWFDEKKYNQGRRFFWNFSFPFFGSMAVGLVALLSVPSILKLLIGTRRSNSPYTAYKRYMSTVKHAFVWFQEDLKPGTKAWRSLYTVRSRHLQAGTAATKKGNGTVSQRDMALTQFAFFGFAVVKPDKFGIRQIESGDWEGFNHFWRTIGYMLGMEDRYNLCRKNIDETREACRILIQRVFTPCLENSPEYFHHSAYVLITGLRVINHHFEPSSVIFLAKYLADVPGYVYNESELIAFQSELKKRLKGKPENTGVDTSELISKSAVEGLPKRPPRLLYVRDFDTIDTTPTYKQLNFAGRYRIALANFMLAVYSLDVGRYFLNLLYRWIIFLSFYFPYKAFSKYGFRESYVNMFVEDPKDDTEPKPNSEYEKPLPPDTWYEKVLTVLW